MGHPKDPKGRTKQTMRLCVGLCQLVAMPTACVCQRQSARAQSLTEILCKGGWTRSTRGKGTSSGPSNEVRVRFAPSPTGQLHLGGLRTALYNYLFARSHNGRFIVRIEDTDQTRLVVGAMEKLLGMLSWSGIQIDEGPHQGGDYGPYIQSSRRDIYWEKVQPLIQNGSAYYCFCTPRRLDLLRKEALRQRETPKYDNRCRQLSASDVEAKLKTNVPYVIRFKLETHLESWEDLVYGPIANDVASIEGDPILIKSDRFPTYHFANVVDDHMMRISHVLRGVEWQPSTTKHILLYKAFNWQPPKFAHLPLLLNSDGTKLSKRQNDIHVEYLKDKGYRPEALLSLLTSAGSGFTTSDTAGMSMEQLVQHFNLALMKTNSTKIELDRVAEYNKYELEKIIKSSDCHLLVEEVRQLVQKHYANRISVESGILETDYIEHALRVCQPRLSVLEDLFTPNLAFIWIVPSQATGGSTTGDQHTVDILVSALHMIATTDIVNFQPDHVGAALKMEAKNLGLKLGTYMSALRRALSGCKEGPPVADMMCILGKKNTVKRLKCALDAENDPPR